MINTAQTSPKTSTHLEYTSPVEQCRRADSSPTTSSADVVESLFGNNFQPMLQTIDSKDLFSEASAIVCQSLLSANKHSGNTNNTTEEAMFQQLLKSPTSPSSWSPLQNNSIRTPQPLAQHKSEMLLPNDLIGCIIGRGGNKINEIRQTSQANIKISSGEEGLSERRITITGTLPAVQMAQNMINNSIQLHKHLLALNMAMNSFYTSKSAPSHESLVWETNVTSNPKALNQMAIPNRPGKNNIEFIETALRNQYLTPMAPTLPQTPTTNCDANVRLYSQLATTIDSTGHITSCTELEREAASVNLNYEEYSARLAELLSQLPQEQQAKWLAACGLDRNLQ